MRASRDGFTLAFASYNDEKITKISEFNVPLKYPTARSLGTPNEVCYAIMHAIVSHVYFGKKFTEFLHPKSRRDIKN